MHPRDDEQALAAAQGTPGFSAQARLSRVSGKPPAASGGKPTTTQVIMGLGHINPQERDWRDAAMEWLESASDQEIIKTYREEIVDPTSRWHLNKIIDEMALRNLLEDWA